MIINIKSPPYNAVGDGVADDTAAIQNAINTAGVNQIYIPSGTYRTTATLKITQHGVTMCGDSQCGFPSPYGSVIAPDLHVQVGLQIGDATHNPFFVTLRDFAVVRSKTESSDIPTDTIGILWQSFNYGREQRVLSSRHGYGRVITGVSAAAISIGYEAVNISTAICPLAYMRIEEAAGIKVVQSDFGLNGGEEGVAPNVVIQFGGSANDVSFIDVQGIPTAETASSRTTILGFFGLTNATGVFNFVNWNSENVKSAIIDSGTPVISQLTITGGRWTGNATGDFFAQGAATLYNVMSFSNVNVGGFTGFTLHGTRASRIQTSYFGLPVILTGGTDADMAFVGNTVEAPIYLTGAWRSLVVTSNSLLQTGAQSVTGGHVIAQNVPFNF